MKKLLLLFAVLATAITTSAQTRESIMLLDSICDGSDKYIYEWNDHGHLIAEHTYYLEDGVWSENIGYGDCIYEYEYDENGNCTRMSTFEYDEEVGSFSWEVERRIATYDENGNRTSVKIYYRRHGEWYEQGAEEENHGAAPKNAAGDYFSYRDGDWEVSGVEGEYLVRNFYGAVPKYKNPEDFQIYCQDVMGWYILPLATLDHNSSVYRPMTQYYIWDEEVGKWRLEYALGERGEKTGETITYYEYVYFYNPAEKKYYATKDGKFDDVPYSYITTVTVNNLGYIQRSENENRLVEYNYLDRTPLLSYKTTINKNSGETETERHYYSEHKLVTGVDGVTATQPATGKLFNLAGQRVGSDYRGVVIRNGKKMVVK